MEKLPFIICSHEEQVRIVEKLEELLSDLDNGVAELQAAQTKLKQYRQSLLKSAVEGTLTEQWRVVNASNISENGEQLLARILKERRARWEEQKEAEFKDKGKKTPKNWKEKYPEPVVPDTSELPKLPEGWVWTTLSSIAEFIQTGPFGSLLHREDYISNGTPLVNPTHIHNQRILPDMELTVSADKLRELGNFIMSEGDIVIGRRGEMGRCAVVSQKEEGWLCGTGSLYIRLLEGINSSFFSRVLSSQRVKDYLSEFSVGTTMQNLNQKILRSVPVPLCPQAEQDEIIKKLAEAFENSELREREISTTLTSTEAQRKNILKDSFSGKLVPQDPTDKPASELLKKIQQERAERAKQPKPRRTKKKAVKVVTMETLEQVLQKQDDWIDAQEAFKACGVADGTDTDRIEELYAELRKLDKAGRLDVERHGDYDKIKLKSE